MDLTGAQVVVTGGGGGIGGALAAAFGAAGADVVTMDLEGRGADVTLDVTDRRATAGVLGALDRLDVVVVNAGVGVAGLEADLEPAAWDAAVEVNVRGTVNTLLGCLPRFRRQGHGAVVIMASLSGLVPTPLLAPYAMTKHALVGLGTSLRPELARDGVGVTVICPGPVETPLLDAPSATPGTDVRRYLTSAAGRPMSAPALAEMVVSAVRRNAPLVVPGRAGIIWRLQRLAPGAVARQLARNMAAELRAARA